MKNIFILIIISCLCISAKAQDIIYQKKRAPIEAHIQTVKSNTILYKRADNPDGPIYELEKGYIDSVVYQNGTIEYFKNARATPPHPGRHEKVYREPGMPKKRRQPDPRYLNPWTQQVTVGAVVYNQDVNLGVYRAWWNTDFKVDPIVAARIKYNKDFFNNWLGVGIAPFVGLNRKAWGSEISLRGNLKHVGRGRLSVGPDYIFSRQEFVSRYASGSSNSATIARKYTTNFSSMYGMIEFFFHATPQVFINLEIGFGGKIGNSNEKKGIPEDWEPVKGNSSPFIKSGLSVGYRF